MSAPTTIRRLFLASLVFFVFSLIFSVTNVVTVLSAPLRSVVTVPQKIGWTGFAADGSGVALPTGLYTVTANIWNAATDGTSLWSQTFINTPITNGLYALTLQVPFTATTVLNGDRWIGITIDPGAEITPRSLVAAVPFAYQAEQAQHVDWGGINGMPSAFSDGIDNTTGGLGTSVAGRVPVYDTTTSVAGASGLTFSSNNLTVAGGVNAGSASGAGTGDVRGSGLGQFDSGTSSYLPFYWYGDALASDKQPFGDDGYPYITGIDRTLTFKKWVVNYYVLGTNNGTNYWGIKLKRRISDSVLDDAATVTTASGSAGAWQTTTVTSFTQSTVDTTHKWLAVHIAKVGSPGTLHLSPSLYVK